MTRSTRAYNAFITIVLSVGALFILLPLYLTVVTAFKSPAMTAENFFSLPTSLYLENFRTVLLNARLPVYLTNSFLVTVGSVGVIVLFIPAVSYAIARNFRRRYYRLLYFVFIAGIFVPFNVIMIPEVKLVTSLGLLGRFGLMMLYWAFSISSNVFLLVGYVRSIPLELEESAFVDGGSVLTVYTRIIFPLIRPMTATVGILSTLWVWNDFLLPLLILNRRDTLWTLPLFQYNFRSQYMYDYNLAFASFFISIIPVTILYAFLQKYIISGLTQGALKG